jgi:hypothetical protein
MRKIFKVEFSIYIKSSRPEVDGADDAGSIEIGN